MDLDKNQLNFYFIEKAKKMSKQGQKEFKVFVQDWYKTALMNTPYKKGEEKLLISDARSEFTENNRVDGVGFLYHGFID